MFEYNHMQGVQLYIEIKDDDVYIPDELVDIISLNINSSVTQSLQQDYTGMYNIVTMNLTVTVFCEENFEGQIAHSVSLGLLDLTVA